MADNNLDNKKFRCDICNKVYKDNSGLWHHNKTIHNKQPIYNKLKNKKLNKKSNKKKSSSSSSSSSNSSSESSSSSDSDMNTEIIKYSCEFCKKKFNTRQSRWRHGKTCFKKKEINDIIVYKEEIEKLKNEIDLLKNNKKKNDVIVKVKDNKYLEENQKQKEMIDKLKDNEKKLLNEIKKMRKKIDNLNNSINKYSCEVIKLKTTNDEMQKILNKKISIPSELRKMVWKKEFGDLNEGNCPVFGCSNIINNDKYGFHAGHIISKHNGGIMSLENLRPLCYFCNSKMNRTNWDDYEKMLKNKLIKN